MVEPPLSAGAAQDKDTLPAIEDDAVAVGVPGVPGTFGILGST
jgi:hypothetical protein